jgi:hypothetical protein
MLIFFHLLLLTRRIFLLFHMLLVLFILKLLFLYFLSFLCFFFSLNSWQTILVFLELKRRRIKSAASFLFAVHRSLYTPYILAIFRLPLPYTYYATDSNTCKCCCILHQAPHLHLILCHKRAVCFDYLFQQRLNYSFFFVAVKTALLLRSRILKNKLLRIIAFFYCNTN